MNHKIKICNAKGQYSHRQSFMVSGTKFVVDMNYQPIKRIGTGAYGVVCVAKDKDTNTKVAIKKVPRAFSDLIDAKRILREIKLLRHFSHKNIIKITDLISPANPQNFDDIYIVFEFMETDLHKIIYSKNVLTNEHCQYFVYQILCGLKYLHSAEVLHRDIKPSNLLLNGDCHLKICDFGLARGVNDDIENAMTIELTEYVVTRWYRAPEIMCACQEYDYKIDVWSLGCILAELILRKPLFPGDDYIHQLNLIFGLLGTPKEEDMFWITNHKAAEYIRSLTPKAPVRFDRFFITATADAIDFLRRTLVFNPHKRISVNEALRHPYLRQLHRQNEEKVCPNGPFNFEFEKYAVIEDGIKALLLEEITHYRPALQKQYEAIYGPIIDRKKRLIAAVSEQKEITRDRNRVVNHRSRSSRK